ncbi:DUF3800 domain-containing protein [Patescibacteria group bacterium]|nr:DUF3800 domain-containing protein [Patescibacteria group bacterium]
MIIKIVLDESGTLPDTKDKFIIISGVRIKNLKEAENIYSRILTSLKQRKIQLQEIKFYHSGQKTKRQFLSGIVSANFEIFILAVNKKGRKIADSPENYALLVADLINEINLWYKNEEMDLIIDRHFYRKIDQDRFQEILKKKIDKDLKYQVEQVDSKQNPLVNIADMTAGAVLRKYNSEDMGFYDLIKENIIIEKIVSWPEIKRRNLNQE